LVYDLISWMPVALAISMDCFSVAIALGLVEKRIKQKVSVSVMLGIFHSAFPLAGLLFGAYLFPFIHHLAAFLNTVIFTTIGLFTLFSIFEEKKQTFFAGWKLIFVCMFVSVDSFPVGLTFGLAGTKHMSMIFLFGVTAMIMSFIGLTFAHLLRGKVGIFGDVFSGILFIYLGWKHFISIF